MVERVRGSRFTAWPHAAPRQGGVSVQWFSHQGGHVVAMSGFRATGGLARLAIHAAGDLVAGADNTPALSAMNAAAMPGLIIRYLVCGPKAAARLQLDL